MRRLPVLLGLVLSASACGGSTAPTPVPPPTPDAPKISCPAAQTIPLTTGSSIAVNWTAPTVANGQLPVTTVCTPQSGSTFSVGAATVTCTATDALQRTDSCTFGVTVLAPPTLSFTRFVAFGDSITAGEDGTDGGPDTSGLCLPKVTTTTSFQPRVILPDAQTYPGQLQASLSARYQTQSPTVLKRGCPGEAVTGPTTRQRFDALITTRQYDVVLIMEGSNDLDATATDDPATQNGNIGSAAAALRLLVDDAKSLGLHPLLATIPPMNPDGSRGGGAGLVTSLNDRIRQINNAESLPTVDVYAAFKGNLSLIGSDGLHPNAAGYTAIAGAFFDVIKSTFETKTSTPTPAATARAVRRR